MFNIIHEMGNETEDRMCVCLYVHMKLRTE